MTKNRWQCSAQVGSSWLQVGDGAEEKLVGWSQDSWWSQDETKIMSRWSLGSQDSIKMIKIITRWFLHFLLPSTLHITTSSALQASYNQLRYPNAYEEICLAIWFPRAPKAPGLLRPALVGFAQWSMSVFLSSLQVENITLNQEKKVKHIQSNQTDDIKCYEAIRPNIQTNDKVQMVQMN